MVDPNFSICVYCGSRSGENPLFAEIARAVGDWIGTHGGQLVYGGGRSGLMGIVADATQAAGGRVAVGRGMSGGAMDGGRGTVTTALRGDSECSRGAGGRPTWGGRDSCLAEAEAGKGLAFGGAATPRAGSRYCGWPGSAVRCVG